MVGTVQPLLLLMMLILGLGLGRVAAALPPDFPGITVSHYNPAATAPGHIFLAVATEATNVGPYLMILENDGTPVWHMALPADRPYDFKMLPNGYLHYAALRQFHGYAKGGDAVHEILDDRENPRETLQMGNGYVADAQDFQLLPNGNALMLGYYLNEVDMSRVVPGGYPAAQVSGAVIQELDPQRNVVWQWRAWDHIPLETFSFENGDPRAPVVSGFPVNSMSPDGGSLLVTTPSAIRKIHRPTGDVLWTLGGAANQFALLGAGADPGHFSGTGAHRLANGNLLMFNHVESVGTGTASVHEYQLDETGFTATHVWSYTPGAGIPSSHHGNAQRLPNGNTFIGWGGTDGAAAPACTEVTAAGEKVFELFFDQSNGPVESHRAFRFHYPADGVFDFEFELTGGNAYTFTGTGVGMVVQSLSPEDYNEVKVTVERYAPVYPIFPSLPPRVVPVRVESEQFGISTITAEMTFDVAAFGFSDPGSITVYQRQVPGQEGLFAPLPTTYDPGTQTVRATVSGFGEFIFGQPDGSEATSSPILNVVENVRGVQASRIVAPRADAGGVPRLNQERPIALSWSPRGFGRFHALQVATDVGFNNVVLDVPFQTQAYYAWSNALPSMNYFWRAATYDESFVPQFSEGAFATVPPEIVVAAPNGGEFWPPGEAQFIQWDDNLAGDVVIELYKAGVLVEEIGTVPGTGAYAWSPEAGLVPGYDYTIRIASADDPAVSDGSDQPFSNTRPVIVPSSVTRMPDGRVQFEISAPALAAVTVLQSSNLTDWQVLESVDLSDGSAVVTDVTAPGVARRFYQFRLP